MKSMKIFYRDHDYKNWKEYNGQELLRGDIVLADVYFEQDESEWKAVDILYKKDENVWIGNEQTTNVYVVKEMIKKIYIDDDYYYRREHPETIKYYWEERENME